MLSVTIFNMIIFYLSILQLKHLTESNDEYFREIKKGVSQALETASLNAQWHKANFDDIKQHLKEFKS